MKLLIATCLLALALSEDPLRAILRSPKAALNLYTQFKSQNALTYQPREDRMRFRLFLNSASEVAAYNEDEEDMADYTINFFTGMTADERKQYLGLNVTGRTMSPEQGPLGARPQAYPSKFFWTTVGGVTEVKNQGSCGSCWTYSGVGAVETHYKAVTGVLREFAEQEYLDCVYQYDGCRGGFENDCFRYSAKHGRLAAERAYPYTGKSVRSECKADSTPNALIAAKITGLVDVPNSEADHVAALHKGALAVAFEVTNKFHSYGGKIMKDTTCHGQANHAVTMVGYTSGYWLIKNSWGRGWGDQGFVKFARNHGNCQLLKWTAYPVMEVTGGKDGTRSDKAVVYIPGKEEGDEGCVDKETSLLCARDAAMGMCAGHPLWDHYVRNYCAETCGYCGGECPGGTVMCGDGVCRHEHMC